MVVGPGLGIFLPSNLSITILLLDHLQEYEAQGNLKQCQRLAIVILRWALPVFLHGILGDRMMYSMEWEGHLSENKLNFPLLLKQVWKVNFSSC